MIFWSAIYKEAPLGGHDRVSDDTETFTGNPTSEVISAHGLRRIKVGNVELSRD